MNWNEFNIQPYSTAIFNNRQHPSINQLSTRGRLQRRGLHSFEAAVGCLRHGLRLHLLGAYGRRDLCLRTHVPWRNGTLERLERREAGRDRGQDLRTMRVASTWMIHTFSIPFLGFYIRYVWSWGWNGTFLTLTGLRDRYWDDFSCQRVFRLPQTYDVVAYWGCFTAAVVGSITYSLEKSLGLSHID